MNGALKQRLVGAIVLVALAVIFLPMLLDGAGTRDDVVREVRIPERPDLAEAELDDVPEAAEPIDEPAEQDPVTLPDETAEAEREADRETQAEAPEVAEDDTPAPAAEEHDVDAHEPEGPGSWAVQTGSFSERDNAETQRDRLQEAGYEAFLAERERDGNRLWRVRVGPVATEEDAKVIRDRIAAEQDLDGITVSHP